MAPPLLPAKRPAPRSVADIVAARGGSRLSKLKTRAGALASRVGESRIGRAARATSQRLEARVRAKPESLTALAAGNYGKAGFALGFGMADRTELAKQFENKAMVRPSTAVLALGLATRVFGLDAAHPRLRQLNTAQLLGLGLPAIYRLGERMMDGVRAAAAVPPAQEPAAAGYTGVAPDAYPDNSSDPDQQGAAEATIS